MGARKLSPQLQSTAWLGQLVARAGQVILGKEEQVTQIICAWIAGGHVLLEDIPGTGKTILARTLSKLVDLPFKRSQFTPDLLPSDLVGANIFNRKTQEFDFRAGPIFSTVFLADEINRATPRTQSALLEAMAERQVSVEGQTYPLDPLFFVLATANPVGQAGTFPLPEAQLDRFFIRTSLGYPSAEDERVMIESQIHNHPVDAVQVLLQREQILQIRADAENIEIRKPVLDYAVALITATRHHEEVLLGASPRATLALVKMAKALALSSGEAFVTPDHLQKLCIPVLAHRLTLTPEARFSGHSPAAIVSQVVKTVRVPIG